MKDIFKSDLVIDLKVVNPSDAKSVIGILRSYSSESISSISKALKINEPVYQTKLLKTQYYSGWQDFYNLVVALSDQDFALEVIANGVVVQPEFAEELKSVVKGIRREDIY